MCKNYAMRELTFTLCCIVENCTKCPNISDTLMKIKCNHVVKRNSGNFSVVFRKPCRKTNKKSQKTVGFPGLQKYFWSKISLSLLINFRKGLFYWFFGNLLISRWSFSWKFLKIKVKFLKSWVITDFHWFLANVISIL